MATKPPLHDDGLITVYVLGSRSHDDFLPLRVYKDRRDAEIECGRLNSNEAEDLYFEICEARMAG